MEHTASQQNCITATLHHCNTKKATTCWLVSKPKQLYIILLLLWSLSITAQSGFLYQLADSAEVLTRQTVRYDPSYFRINYPNGDVPADRGVCTDVIIRAYRKLGIDLQ